MVSIYLSEKVRAWLVQRDMPQPRHISALNRAVEMILKAQGMCCSTCSRVNFLGKDSAPATKMISTRRSRSARSTHLSTLFASATQKRWRHTWHTAVILTSMRPQTMLIWDVSSQSFVTNANSKMTTSLTGQFRGSAMNSHKTEMIRTYWWMRTEIRRAVQFQRVWRTI